MWLIKFKKDLNSKLDINNNNNSRQLSNQDNNNKEQLHNNNQVDKEAVVEYQASIRNFCKT
jgi:hypothetical protein